MHQEENWLTPPPPGGRKTGQSAHRTLSSTALAAICEENFRGPDATSQPSPVRGRAQKRARIAHQQSQYVPKSLTISVRGSVAQSRSALTTHRPSTPEKPHFGAAPGGTAPSAKHHPHPSRKRSPLGFPGEIPNPGGYLAESTALQRHCRSPENAHLFPVSCCSAQVPTGDWRPPNRLTFYLRDGMKYGSASAHHPGLCGNRSEVFSRKTSPHDAIPTRGTPENVHQTSGQARKPR